MKATPHTHLGCDDCWDIVAQGNDRPIVSVPFWDDDDDWAARAEATARLFAAAPELLEALRIADTWMAANSGNHYAGSATRKLVRAAIGKAELGASD